MKTRLKLIFCLLLAGIGVALLNKLLMPNSAIAESQNAVPNASTLSMPSSSFNFTRQSLTSALPQEVGQVALNYTSARFKVLSGTPNVVVARKPTINDLSALGFPTNEYDPEDNPLMLVVLKGDFDVSNIRGRANSKWHRQVEYIAYLFDLRAGVPTLTQTSAKGGILRKLLNNPSLPDDPVANPEALEQLKNRNLPEAIVVPPEPQSIQKLPYGSTAPDITPSKDPKDLPPFASPDKPM